MSRALAVLLTQTLGAHAAAWDELVARQALPTPFLRSWWLGTTADPAATTYVLVLSGEELVGGLVLGHRRVMGITRFGGAGPDVLCPDHLDLVAAPGAEREVVAAVSGWLAKQRPWVLDLRGVREGSLLAEAVGTVAVDDDVAPWQPLPDDGDWLATRSSNFRRSVRRSRRRLEEGGMTVRATTPDAVRAALAAFRALHGDREGRGPLLAEQDRLDAAIVAGVERGEARVDVFGSDDVVAAVSVAFTVAGRLCLYQLARSLDDAHDGAGTALLAAVVENAAEKGCREVDLLRGDEGYKRSFADEQRTLGRLRAAGGLRGRLLLAAEDAARRVKAAVSARRTSRRAGSAA